MKPIKLIKNRSDIGAGTHGSDLGVDAIEIAAINQGSDYFNQFPFEDIKTHNESIYDKDRSTVAKRIEHCSGTVYSFEQLDSEKLKGLFSYCTFRRPLLGVRND